MDVYYYKSYRGAHWLESTWMYIIINHIGGPLVGVYMDVYNYKSYRGAHWLESTWMYIIINHIGGPTGWSLHGCI